MANRSHAITCVLLLLMTSLVQADTLEGTSRPDGEALLARFLPMVYAENKGYSGGPRMDWPYAMTDPGVYPFGSGTDMEDNWETFITSWDPGRYTVYGHAEQMVDPLGTTYWLLQYFYYLPGDYDSKVFWCPFGFKHEHDWEWVCIFVGESNTAPSADHLAPFLAVLSGHLEDNLDLWTIWANNIFWDHLYLFPHVAISVNWLESHDPMLVHAAWLGCATATCEYSETAQVAMRSTGNQFTSTSGLLFPVPLDGSPAIITDAALPTSWTTEELDGEECVDVTSSSLICYGNQYVCLAGTGDRECDNPREVPWARPNTWGASGVPSNFIFPPPDVFRVIPSPQPEAGPTNTAAQIRVIPTISRAGFDIGSSAAGPTPQTVEILGPDGRLVRALEAHGVDGTSPFVHWDGTDAAGQPVPSAAYYVRARWSHAEDRCRMVLIR